MVIHSGKRILDFIQDFIGDNNYPPTIREICHGCNISSPSVANYHLEKLEIKGYIQRDKHKARAIKLLKEGTDG